jgi:alcohol dehydrogenase class IV
VISIPETYEKHGIITPRVFPKVAVIDPRLMVSLPARPTAGTGFDAIGHALEAYVSKFTTPMADLFALEALRIAAIALPQVVDAPTDLDARGRMAWAATLGGAAIANAGMTVTHGIAQALGGRFHVPHGEAVALCLPETLETLLAVRASRLARVAEVMGFATGRKSESELAEACIQGLKTLRRVVHLEIPLGTLGVSAGDVDQLVDDVFATQQWSLEHHPAKLERRDVRGILETLL